MTTRDRPSATKILLATSNQGKIAEIRRLVEGKGIMILQPSDVDIDIDIEEDKDTLEGNAVKKATELNDLTGLPCLADDTGLEVSALGGRPGVHSARYAGPAGDAKSNRVKLLNELMGHADRSARFRTVVAFVDGEGTHIFEGTCEGYIARGERGNAGFGYDPLFIPAGFETTFAEMTIDQKNVISHRARALARFLEFLDKRMR
ncbi:MAG: RdgB/HAM1 family non-canonical purine NTP pyrophosphatase [Rhodothermales bacterium]|nr:RdgB/HAM1 family non-canonical purine NTP pyrophosphatase [Rhodothermales bacterium]